MVQAAGIRIHFAYGFTSLPLTIYNMGKVLLVFVFLPKILKYFKNKFIMEMFIKEEPNETDI